MLSRKNCRRNRRKEMIKIDPFKRSFKASPKRRMDPLGYTAVAYTPSFLASPIGAAIAILLGMTGTLFFLTVSLGRSLESGPDLELAEVLRLLDLVFALYDRLIGLERVLINRFHVGMNDFDPEVLAAYYSALRELIFFRECLFHVLSIFVDHHLIDSINAPIVGRINLTLEELRGGGNNLVVLLRELEERLNIPENLRMALF
jgi:hypothetical protein